MTDDPFTLLRRSDPAADATASPTERAEREALLERIVRTPRDGDARVRTTRRLAGRRYLVPALVVAVVVALVALPASRVLQDQLGGGGAAQAATPPLLTAAHAPREAGAAQQLRRIADRVAALPNDVGSGSGVRVEYRAWSLSTRIDGVDTRSRVVPETVVRALGSDGRGQITTTASLDDGSKDTRTDRVEESPVAPLPTTLPEMTQTLAQRNPSGPAGRFNAIVETLLERPAGPAARAAILRYLAVTPTVASVGSVTDRLGRAGEGFAVQSSASGLPTRYLLIVDPRSGVVLGYEEMLTRDAGRLDVAVPSVISYTAWESARYE